MTPSGDLHNPIQDWIEGARSGRGNSGAGGERPTDPTLPPGANTGPEGLPDRSSDGTDDDVSTPPSAPGPVVEPQTAGIGGVVFQDVNGNGRRSRQDRPMANVVVYLDANHDGRRQASEQAVLTDAQGRYSFTGLLHGTYPIRAKMPRFSRVSVPVSGFHHVVVGTGEVVTGKNLGITQTAQVSGTVFADANRNGSQDAAEAGLGGWRVFVDRNGNGKRDRGEAAARTDAGGNFTMVLPAGKHALRVLAKRGCKCSTPEMNNLVVKLKQGRVSDGWTFGYWR